MAEGEVEGGDDGAVGLGGGCEDEAAVWERGGTGEVVEEPFDDCELVGVYGLVRVGYVMGVFHRVREPVHAEHQWWAVREREFPVYQFEYRPSDFGVLSAEEGETGEGDIWGDGDREFVLARRLREL